MWGVAYQSVRLCIAFAVMALALLFAHVKPAQAQPIRPTVCIAAANPGDTIKARLNGLANMDCTRPQTAFGPGDYWVHLKGFSAKPQSGDQLVFRQVSMWQESARIHFRYADGKTVQSEFRADHAATILSVGAFFEFPIPWREAPLTDIIVKVHKSANVRGILLSPEIMTARESAALKAKWVALYALFTGVALTLLVYNLVLGAALRYRFQFQYCGMVVAMMAYTFCASGSLVLAFPSINNVWRMQAGYVFLQLTAAMTLLFFRDFFEPRVITPKLRRAITIAAATLFISPMLFLALSGLGVPHFDKIYYAGFLAILLAFIPIIISAVRQKSDFVLIFLLAWAAPVIMAVARSLHGIGLLPYNFWLDNSSILAFAVEALVSSSAISIRLRQLSRDRDRARAEEAAARHLAKHDALTGLLNRRGFLEEALGREGQSELILLDIDHFKRINDCLGHDCGDEVLQTLSLTLRKWAPEGALLSRVGGEEFAVLLPAGEAQPELSEGLLQAIRIMRTRSEVAVTASLGIALGRLRNDEDWQRLYRQADQALYRAKNEGRDRICRPFNFAIAA